jgi:hypothetical protein
MESQELEENKTADAINRLNRTILWGLAAFGIYSLLFGF